MNEDLFNFLVSSAWLGEGGGGGSIHLVKGLKPMVCENHFLFCYTARGLIRLYRFHKSLKCPCHSIFPGGLNVESALKNIPNRRDAWLCGTPSPPPPID